MPIYMAILKYGYSNFTLDILEYCEPSDLLAREQYYLDLIKPGYNLLSVAGSSLGFKHSEETLDKFKSRVLSDEARANLVASATGRVLSEDTKAKISAARSGIKLSAETRAKMSAATAAIQGVAVEVTNIQTGITEQFSTLTDAASFLGVSRTTVKNVVKSGKIFRDIYSIKLKD